MKTLTLLSLALLSTTAHATGMVQVIHDCSGGSGEARSSVKVRNLSTSAPGGPVHRWTEAEVSTSWLGGTHYSGVVEVKNVAAPRPGGPETYINSKQGFSLTISDQRGTNSSGRPGQITVTAKFKDPKTNMIGQVGRRTLQCR